ncbi:HAD family hydrolase [Actinomadura opuntiae]|uniref:HAD family hydrolase n=1 Tax=Actinomadura sp. OS1-43 TaxID=604315 RepID=UPI00255A86F5|nr:HAD family phosphatase [Actinomadura sp. OS1-43]MDL4812863.1 HAD family phosphatase [Actinomadura sp. OS1-43]
MEWVIVDYGEVVCRTPPEDAAARLAAAAAGADPAAFWELYWSGRDAYDLGTVDAAGYWGELCGRLGRAATPALLEDLVRLDLEMWSHLQEGTLQILRDLDARRVPLALLSNAPLEMARHIEAAPWSAVFRHRFFSADLRLAKPDPAIFEHVAARLGAAPADLTFVDDRPANVEAARTAGLRAFLFTTPAQLRHDLAL